MKAFFRSPRALLTAAVLSCVASFLVGGRLALVGMATGLAGTILNIYGLHRLTTLFASSMREEKAARSGAFLTVFLFLLKVPVFVLLAFAMYKVGNPAPQGFLAGMALVYFALVGWSQSQI